MMENPNFLKQKYELHKTPEVEKASKRTEKRTGEKVSQKPKVRIQNYLDRFKEITEREDPDKRERGMEALKKVLHDKFVIEPENVPYRAFELEQDIAEQQGYGRPEITEEFKEKKISEITSNQEKSLDRWIDYLSSEDAMYPDWLKYWSFRSMLEMGKYNKEKEGFERRTKDTVAPFPLLNPRALSLTLDAVKKRKSQEYQQIEQKIKEQKNQLKKLKGLRRKGEFVEEQSLINIQQHIDNLLKDKDALIVGDRDYSESEQGKFLKTLETEDFSKLYAHVLKNIPEFSEKGLENIKGEWVKYDQNSDHMPLVKSIEGYPLEWCTAGEDTAKSQIEGGDFYVYYSENNNGENKIPRLAIRMNGKDEIGEIRGIEKDQNIDQYIQPVLDEKLEDFGQEGERYKEKSVDMKKMTEITQKHRNNQELNKEDLIFLYEIEKSIEGFGYQKDPRIKEIRQTRNPIEDASIVFECEPNQIANTPEEINENTKAYIGELKSGIFETIQKYNIEHIYTKFPEGKIEQIEAEIGGKSEQEILSELEARERLEENDKDKIYISDYAKDILKHEDFVKSLYKNPDEPREKWELKNKEQIKFIKLKVSDLGLSNNATTDDVYGRAEELGLELCPPETGSQIRLNYEEIFNREQPEGECIRIGMKQIIGSGGLPGVFGVYRYGGESWLHDYWAGPGNWWHSDFELVFRPRHSTKN